MCWQVRDRKGALLGRRTVRVYTPGTATDLPQARDRVRLPTGS